MLLYGIALVNLIDLAVKPAYYSFYKLFIHCQIQIKLGIHWLSCAAHFRETEHLKKPRRHTTTQGTEQMSFTIIRA